jgi:hypothetical protein
MRAGFVPCGWLNVFREGVVVRRWQNTAFLDLSGLFNKLRFEFHGPNAIDFTIDIVITIDEADVFNFSSHLYYRG